MTPEWYDLLIIKPVHVELCQLCNCSTQVNQLVTLDLLMPNVSNGKVPIVERVVNESLAYFVYESRPLLC